MTPPTTTEPTASAASTMEQDRVCTGCGYDLRGIESEVCPECGLEFDRNQPVVSKIPWIHRRTIGRVRAYRQTVWLALVNPKRLAAEIARPVPFADAQRFRLVTVFLAALPIIGVLLWMAIHFEGKEVLSIASNLFKGLNVGSGAIWPASADLFLPFDAGVAYGPVLPLAIVLAFLLITGVASYWFHPADLSVVRQNRAIAISYFACAPLLWIWPLTIGMAAAAAIESEMQPRGALRSLVTVCFFVGGLSELLLPITLWRSTMSLLRHTTRPSMGRLVLAGIVIPISWILSAALALGVLPFVVGFFRLVFASLH